ncbi:MAG: hypothetical protein GXZ13_02365 [Synergistaceae bacterium]|jgi:hypothetical protein|nr:hypothetical protein [Synergistaceae bacterium]
MHKHKGYTLIEFIILSPIFLLYTALIASSFSLTAKLQDHIENKLAIELLKQECLTRLLSGTKPEKLSSINKKHVIKIIGLDEGDYNIEFHFETYFGEEKDSIIWATKE